MQEPHERDHHHPPRLIRALAAAVAALAVAAPAHAARYAALPSPVAPLSDAPPLGGGATSSAEATRHRIASSTNVQVSVDRDGRPFAVAATQRLDVRVQGDYFFTIAAPVLDVVPAAGTASTPGFRTGSIVWAGFDPGRRVLAARATLDTRQVRNLLPLRIETAPDHVTLVNATAVTVGGYTSDALRPSLVSYLQRLRTDVRRGRLPLGGSAQVTSAPVAVRVTVAAPLRVTGTIGARRISLVLTGRATVPATGRVHLRVTPLERVSLGDLSRLDGRQLLALATRISLTLARTRQYESFLGNPDPTGASETAYVYRTAKRPRPPLAVAAPTSGSRALTTVLVAAGLVVAAAAAAAIWARS